MNNQKCRIFVRFITTLLIMLVLMGTAGVVYAEDFEYDVDFDPNVPRNASTKDMLSGSMQRQRHTYSQEQALTENVYVLPGYDFDGWSTNPDGTGDRYADKETVKNLTDVKDGVFKLYAQWKPKKYTVTFKSGAEQASKDCLFDKSEVIKPFADFGWTEEGQTFNNWRCLETGNVYGDREDFYNLCQVKGDGTLSGYTLAAQWIDNGFITVTTTINGQPQHTASFFKLVDPYRTINIPVEDNNDGVYKRKLDILNDSVIELWLVAVNLKYGDIRLGSVSSSSTFAFTLGRYTVRVRKDPAVDQNLFETVAEGGLLVDPWTDDSLLSPDGEQLDLNTTINEQGKGYHFDGYSVTGVMPGNADDSAEMDLQAADQEITVRGQAEIVAHIAPNVYTVHFDQNADTGVLGKMEDQDMVYDQPQDLFENQFERKGSTFAGWNTEKDGSGYSFDDKQNVQKLTTEDGGEVTLYAQWDNIQYNIEYDLQGGKYAGGKENPKTFDVDTPSFQLIEPKRKGFDFAGWTMPSTTTPQKELIIPQGSTEDRKYIANWIPKKMPVVIAKGVPSGSKTIKTSWPKTQGASKYLVYGSRCGGKMKLLKTTKSTSFTVKSIKGKKLKKHQPYVFRVIAKDKAGKTIAKSKLFHVITTKTWKKYANIKKITVAKSALTLNKGDTATIKAKYTLPKGKKHLSKNHGTAIVYTSDTPGVVKVSSKGKITAMAPGTATIYIQDISGIYCKVKVAVS